MSYLGKDVITLTRQVEYFMKTSAEKDVMLAGMNKKYTELQQERKKSVVLSQTFAKELSATKTAHSQEIERMKDRMNEEVKFKVQQTFLSSNTSLNKKISELEQEKAKLSAMSQEVERTKDRMNEEVTFKVQQAILSSNAPLNKKISELEQENAKLSVMNKNFADDLSTAKMQAIECMEKIQTKEISELTNLLEQEKAKLSVMSKTFADELSAAKTAHRQDIELLEDSRNKLAKLRRQNIQNITIQPLSATPTEQISNLTNLLEQEKAKLSEMNKLRRIKHFFDLKDGVMKRNTFEQYNVFDELKDDMEPSSINTRITFKPMDPKVAQQRRLRNLHYKHLKKQNRKRPIIEEKAFGHLLKIKKEAEKFNDFLKDIDAPRQFKIWIAPSEVKHIVSLEDFDLEDADWLRLFEKKVGSYLYKNQSINYEEVKKLYWSSQEDKLFTGLSVT